MLRSFASFALAGLTAFALCAPTLSWYRQIPLGTSEQSTTNLVRTDAQGNVIVVGALTNTANPDPNSRPFIAKYSSSGTLLWRRIWETFSGPTCMAIGGDSSIWVGGSERIGNASRAQVRKYSPAGSLLLNRVYGGTVQLGSAGFQHIVLDPQGNACLAGFSVTRSDTTDVLVTRYSPTGTLLWGKTWSSGTARYDRASHLALDSKGGLMMGGSTGSNAPNAPTDAKIWRISQTTGNLLWHQTRGEATDFNWLESLRLDPQGNVLASIARRHPITNHTVYGIQRIALADGKTTMGPIFPSQTHGLWHGITRDASGNIYALTGFDSNQNVPRANSLLVKFAPSGTKIWERKLASSSVDVYAHGIEADSKGNVIALLKDETSTGATTIRLTKFSPSGSALWSFSSKRPSPAVDTPQSFWLASDTTSYILSVGQPKAYDFSYKDYLFRVTRM